MPATPQKQNHNSEEEESNLMYLGILHVTIDLEPEVAAHDRERVLRALRDKVKQQHGQRITARTDDDAAIAIAVLDDHSDRIKIRLEEIGELIDAAGQARILTSTAQVFCWYEGRFVETAESMAENSDDEEDSFAGQGAKFASQFGAAGKTRLDKTIVYSDDDDGDASSGRGSVNRALGRKGLRIPTRK